MIALRRSFLSVLVLITWTSNLLATDIADTDTVMNHFPLMQNGGNPDFVRSVEGMKEKIAHGDATDMPDTGGTNSDHDVRYVEIAGDTMTETLTVPNLITHRLIIEL